MVLYQRIGCEDAVYHLPVHVKPIRDLGILEDPHVKVGPRHPPQLLQESDAPPVPYTINTKNDNSFPEPYRPSADPTHIYSLGPAHS